MAPHTATPAIKKPTIVCDPNGDLILVAGPKHVIKVRSQFLADKSPVFRVMLEDDIKNKTLSSKTPEELGVSKGNSGAFATLCTLIYGMKPHIAKPNVVELWATTKLAYKYDTIIHVKLELGKRVRDLIGDKRASPWGTFMLLCAAYLLGDKEAFSLASNELIMRVANLPTMLDFCNGKGDDEFPAALRSLKLPLAAFYTKFSSEVIQPGIQAHRNECIQKLLNGLLNCSMPQLQRIQMDAARLEQHYAITSSFGNLVRTVARDNAHADGTANPMFDRPLRTHLRNHWEQTTASFAQVGLCLDCAIEQSSDPQFYGHYHVPREPEPAAAAPAAAAPAPAPAAQDAPGNKRKRQTERDDGAESDSAEEAGGSSSSAAGGKALKRTRKEFRKLHIDDDNNPAGEGPSGTS